jgi:hypothetical protein
MTNLMMRCVFKRRCDNRFQFADGRTGLGHLACRTHPGNLYAV